MGEHLDKPIGHDTSRRWSAPRRALALSCITMAVVVCGYMAVRWMDEAVKQSYRVGQHTFELAERPAYLTEALAIAKTREALALHVSNIEDWTIIPYPNAKAAVPDGRPDLSFARSAVNPNAGYVLFRDQRAWDNGHVVELFVNISLEGNRVTCTVERPK